MNDFTKPHIYLRQLIPTGKFYIGKHIGTNKTYRGSGIDWVVALREHVTNYRTDVVTEILEYIDDVSNINEREEYWLKKYDVASNPLFYNRSNRSRGWTIVTEEQRRKIGDAHKGIKQSRESVEKRADMMRNIPKHSDGSKSNIGDKNRHPKPEGFRKNGIYKCTDEHKENLSKAKGYKVYQYDLEGNFIQEWRNGAYAALNLGLSQSSVNGCIKGKIKKTHGFIFKKEKKYN